MEIDFTLHAKQLVSCLQHIVSIKDKVGVDDLALTYIGSKSVTVKSNKLDQVPEHGKGKGSFKSTSHLTSFINYLVIKDIFVQNLRDDTDRVKSTYLTLGEIKELLNGDMNVMYSK